jgi:DNA-binding transcriptional MerR regulator/methylmalonyl-CoA mutase cobalamin-binding subunit
MADANPRYPVRLAALKSGITPHVLRAWERRYRVVTPGRSAGGQRLYSDDDIERLRLLRRLTAQGHGIGQLAKLPLDELERLWREEEQTEEVGPTDFGMTERAVEFRSAVFKAAQCLAAGELQGALERSAVTLGVPAFLEQVAAPAIREIGHGWQDGTITVGQEHLATAVFRRVLGWIIDTFDVNEPSARLIVGTPPRQAHELGALLAAAAAAAEGWDVIYLGADLPVGDIINATKQANAQAVALSIVTPEEDGRLVEELKQVRQGLGPEVHLFLGGAAVTRQPERFASIAAVLPESLTEFRLSLQELQNSFR